ncbi:MAG: serine/threonine protein kinase, partial [Anaerolineae bacterium]|nr:serine/threonine protein kinase [Anaerolineae bacterium]
GGTLKQRLTRKIPYQDAAALLAPVARALEFAHKQGIIHRDVKPANILIDSSGSPLLSDFGIAKMLDTQEATQLTGTGVGIGTPDYMAPEQWLGQASRATDIYALGVVFYEMVTGCRPFVADTPAAVLLKHMNDPLPRPRSFAPELPDSVEQVIFKALAKKPEDRFSDMGALAVSLEALSREEKPTVQVSPQIAEETVTQALAEKSVFQAGESASAEAPAGSLRTEKSSLTKWTLGGAVILMIGLASVLCVAAGLIYYFSRPAKPDQTLDTAVPAKTTAAVAVQGQKSSVPTWETTAKIERTPFVSIEGLPADIPVLPQNNGDLTIMTQSNVKMYMFTTQLSMEEAIAFYHDGMIANGWEETVTSEQPGQFLMLNFQKDDGNRIVMVMASPASGNTMVNIQVPEFTTEFESAPVN